MQVQLNKKEKEELVVKLHQENKTIRQIAEIVHMSFKDIGTIIRRINGTDNDEYIDTKLENKSKETKALWLFEQKKRPIDVAVELDLPYGEVIDLQLEYWALKELYDLPLVYHELKHEFDSFFKLFKILKKK
jgi:transposase